MRSSYSIFILWLIGALLSGCRKDNGDIFIDYHEGYYPLTIGHYVAYDVDSILYGFNNPVYKRDTVSYQMMEVLADTFYDNENELNYRVELFRRADSLSQWGIWKVGYLKKTQTTLQKVEDDIRFVKLIFPPKRDESWNGNLYVPVTAPFDVFKDWDYFFEKIHEPYSVNGLSFDSTLTVHEIDEESLIEKKLRRTVYAKGVGMVYQEWESLAKQRVDQNWESGPETGFRIRMRVFDHN